MHYRPLFIILLLLISSCSSSYNAGPIGKSAANGIPISSDKNNNLKIIFEPDARTMRPRFKVQLEFSMNQTGQQRLKLPSSWAGQSNLFSGISEITAQSPNTEILPGSDPSVRIVKGTPFKRVSVTYTLTQTFSGSLSNERHFYRPIISSDYVHFIGEAALVLPDMPLDQPQSVTLMFRNIPSHWNLAHSFAENKKTVSITASLNELKYSLFVMGDFRLHQATINGGKVVTALRGKWQFNDDDFQSKLSTIITMQRQFWTHGQSAYFLVSLIPSDDGDSHFAGTSLTNSMALFVSANAPINSSMLHMISHESFHAWNGRLIKRDYPEELVFWFSEGFTNYYARKLNHKAGLIDSKTYVREMNEVLKQYYASPVRSAGNNRVLGEFWSNRNINQLPYLKGEILAMIWNDKIKHSTGKSLDDFMRDLESMATKLGTKISNHSIANVMARYIPQGVDLDMKRFIDSGEMFDQLPSTLGNCAQLVWNSFTSQPVGNHWGSIQSYTPAKIKIPQYQLQADSCHLI